MKDETIKAIEQSIKKDLPFEFSDNDILIISEWAYGIYKDGWNNAKILLKDNKKHLPPTVYPRGIIFTV